MPIVKRYRLRKDLPDVQAGAIFEMGKDVDAYFLTSDKTGTKYNCYAYPKDFVENNPPWFSIIHATEWEVLSINYKGSISKWISGRGYTLDELKRDGYNIHSVQRLSDGKIFTVGDVVVFDGHDDARKIASFKIDSCESMLVSDGTWSILLLGVQHAARKEKTESKENKEWEIEEFVTKYMGHNNVHFVKGKDERFRTSLNGQAFSHSEAELLKEPAAKISSVRRLSDGTLFSLGDEIEYRKGCEVDWSGGHWPGRILSFRKVLTYDHKIKMQLEINDKHEWNRVYFPAKFIENIRHKQTSSPQKERWETTDTFVAACTALDSIMKSAKDDAGGINGLWSIAHINTFQDELIKLGYSIQPVK